MFVVALSGLFLAGCAQNDEMLPEENKTWVKATVETPATRLSVDMSELSPAWVFNDGIMLETTNQGWKEYKLKSGQGTKVGLFEGSGTPKTGSCAIYPASHAGNGTYTFPTEYEFRPLNYDGNSESGDPISEIPMVGKIRGEDDIKFYHVGGAIALKFDEITPSQHKLTVTFEGAPVTGTATVDASNPDAALVPTSSTGQVVTVFINKTMQYTLRNQTILVPVPAGTYSKVSIDLSVKDGAQYISIVNKSRTKNITITKGGIFSFAQLETDYQPIHDLRMHFPIGGNLVSSYDETKMILCWVNTVTDVAFMDADGNGHEPVSLSSTYYHEIVDDGNPNTTDIYYQYVRLNDEMVNNGFYQLKDYNGYDSNGYYYWYLNQSRGYRMYCRLKCADPTSSTLTDGTPNIQYYRFSFEAQSQGSWVPVGYFMKEDMEILYKAYKAGRITNGNSYIYDDYNFPVQYKNRYLTTNLLINYLFGGNYDMENENQQVIWSKPYFEEVNLPGGAKDYVLQTPTLDNGFFLVDELITYLKNSTATITVTEQTGSVAPGTYPVGEFVHTKFMLLYAVAEQGAPTN
jgi:hypothetical protein